jgi:hypothetical protein
MNWLDAEFRDCLLELFCLDSEFDELPILAVH